MKWTTVFKEDRNFIRVDIEGVFDVGDHLRMIQEIVSNKDWKPGMDALFDNRKVHFGENGFDLIWRAGMNHTQYDESIGNGKSAILMKASDFRLGREFEMLLDEKAAVDLRIFMEESEALRWLNIY